MTRRILCLALAAAVCAPGTAAAARARPISGASTVLSRFSGIPQHRNRVGAPGAPVTITVFGDIASPPTRRLSERTIPPLLRRYVRPGRLKMVFRPVAVTSIASERGALAVEAAALQDAAWPMACLLLRNQGREGRDWLGDAEIAAAATKLGLDADRLARDAGSRVVAQAFFRDDGLWRALRASSVPVSVVRGPRGRRLIVGAAGPRAFAAAIGAVG